MNKYISFKKIKFRELTITQRDKYIRDRHGLNLRKEPDLEVLNKFTEHVIGRFSYGQSLVLDARINSKYIHLPLATEEPSVVAAINKAVKLFNIFGVSAYHDKYQRLTGQVHFNLKDISSVDISNYLKNHRDDITSECVKLVPKLARLISRGGGFVGPFIVKNLNNSNFFKLEFDLDVKESMGANTVNLVAENIADHLKRVFQESIRIICSILSNDCSERKSYACVTIPLYFQNLISFEVAKKIQDISTIAYLDKQRAVTHNKGIMNGVTALAQATGQDTRAIEAAVHSYAATMGNHKLYGPLSSWELKNDILIGKISLPSPVTTVGRLADFHDHVRDNFALMQNPTAFELGHCLAYVGLASNFSALLALSTNGISNGHMALHNCGIS